VEGKVVGKREEKRKGEQKPLHKSDDAMLTCMPARTQCPYVHQDAQPRSTNREVGK